MPGFHPRMHSNKNVCLMSTEMCTISSRFTEGPSLGFTSGVEAVSELQFGATATLLQSNTVCSAAFSSSAYPS